MMPVPPRLVRRVLLAPLVLLLEGALIVASPLLALIALVLAPVAGSRPLRAIAIGVDAAARHAATTLASFGLWLTRRGDMETHYDLMRWFVGGVYRTIERVARVEVRVVESEDVVAELDAARRPAIVLARHAGEGDSLLVLHALLCRPRRQPRLVLHEALRLDPVIDVLGRRLPNRFVDPRGGDTEVEIAAMTRGIDPKGAVLIFPEGGNFSPERRRRGIERLEQAGHEEEAAWAREMRHVSAPRPGGALAAIEAAPGADVVFVGHAGVPIGLKDMWRQLPKRQTIELKLWLAPAGEVPPGRDEQIDWLFGWWRTLDGWVAERAQAAMSNVISPR
jgi:1-acyl-sn-glycerol-3-phosphate acyltransferase